MEEALRFFGILELWIYLILGFGGVIFLWKFMLAWQELRGAAFGLERENAQARLNQAASVLVLLITLTVLEFALVSFVAPAVPSTLPFLTPTLDLLATPTITLPPTTPQPAEAEALPAPTATAGLPGEASGCIADQVIITAPAEGEEIKGSVPITGTVNIPDFGFYKLEMKRPEETNWLTILAGNQLKQGETLGFWNTSLLAPGYHQLSLVVTDNQGKSLPPCTIQVRVSNADQNP
jgi:hypothetical protein